MPQLVIPWANGLLLQDDLLQKIAQCKQISGMEGRMTLEDLAVLENHGITSFMHNPMNGAEVGVASPRFQNIMRDALPQILTATGHIVGFHVYYTLQEDLSIFGDRLTSEGKAMLVDQTHRNLAWISAQTTKNYVCEMGVYRPRADPVANAIQEYFTSPDFYAHVAAYAPSSVLCDASHIMLSAVKRKYGDLKTWNDEQFDYAKRALDEFLERLGDHVVEFHSNILGNTNGYIDDTHGVHTFRGTPYEQLAEYALVRACKMCPNLQIVNLEMNTIKDPRAFVKQIMKVAHHYEIIASGHQIP